MEQSTALDESDRARISRLQQNMVAGEVSAILAGRCGDITLWSRNVTTLMWLHWG